MRILQGRNGGSAAQQEHQNELLWGGGAAVVESLGWEKSLSSGAHALAVFAVAVTCVPQPGVGVTAQDLASQCLVLNLAALGCPERSLFPREEIPAGPCSSSPAEAAESPGWVEGTLFPLPEQGWVIQHSLSERSSPTDGLG